MLQFGTPLTRGEMKQIKGGSACVECIDGGGNYAGSATCYTSSDCLAAVNQLCPDSGCNCYAS